MVSRINQYHLLCYVNLQLKCFSDESHVCICDKNRFANCLTFNHEMNYNCQDSNQCSNHGICLQDNVTCPKTITCICEKCFYGSKCDLTSKGFSVSLDVILGYHIQPLIPFQQQSITVKITAALTMFMFLFGFISGICSMITFLQKEILNIGCGIYLLINSIVSLLTVSLLTIKYWQLVLFQMNLITYHGFVHLNCILIDLLLKSCVSFTDWLNASVAIEFILINYKVELLLNV